MATLFGGIPSGEKPHSSFSVFLLKRLVLVTIFPPVVPEALVRRSNSSEVRTLGYTPYPYCSILLTSISSYPMARIIFPTSISIKWSVSFRLMHSLGHFFAHTPHFLP